MTETQGTLGEVLEADHHAIDAYFATYAASLDAGEVDREALASGLRALRHHIWVEEEYHFPPLRSAGLMGPILVMLREHGEIWDLMDRIEAAPEGPVAREAWARLRAVLEAHNMKEEHIVYPHGDEVLNDADAADVRDALVNDTFPQGWVCAMAGRS